MVQDFAKLRAAAAPEKKTPPPAPANKTLLFTGLLTGMALGVFGCFLVYLSGVLPPVGQQALQEIDTAALAQDQADAQQKLNEDLERAAAQLQLEFYQELPNYEVIVNTLPEPARRPQQTRTDAARAVAEPAASGTAARSGQDAADAALARTIAELTGEAAAPAPAADAGGTYMIQAGAFQQEPAAINQSNRLIALGLNARVKKEALLGKTLFLVQAGPYRNREQLSQVERILRSNSIDSMRITLGGL